jgi:hypothetical protein
VFDVYGSSLPQGIVDLKSDEANAMAGRREDCGGRHI